MALDSAAVADALVTALSGLSGIGAVQIGAPKSVGPQVMSYVTAGSIQTVRKATAVMERTQRFFVMFAYRVDDDEATSEETLMDLVDAFMAAIHADMTIGGNVTSAEVASLAADEPEYQARAGKEYREYPVIVTVTQRGSYTVNP